MTTTDVIYGITMVEKGISRVVPVDLRELAWFDIHILSIRAGYWTYPEYLLGASCIPTERIVYTYWVHPVYLPSA
jgi:hypothetical protein